MDLYCGAIKLTFVMNIIDVTLTLIWPDVTNLHHKQYEYMQHFQMLSQHYQILHEDYAMFAFVALPAVFTVSNPTSTRLPSVVLSNLTRGYKPYCSCLSFNY